MLVLELEPNFLCPPFFTSGKIHRPFDLKLAQGHICYMYVFQQISWGAKRLAPKKRPITLHGELDFFAVKNESETPLASRILARLPLRDSRKLLKVGPRDCL